MQAAADRATVVTEKGVNKETWGSIHTFEEVRFEGILHLEGVCSSLLGSTAVVEHGYPWL